MGRCENMSICFIVSSGKELTLHGNEYEEPFVIIQAELKKVLNTLYSAGYRHYIITAEWGIPLWMGEQIIKLRDQHPEIFLTIIVPYEEQAKDWLEYQRDRYFKLHQLADQVILLNTHWSAEAEEEALCYALRMADLLYVFGKPEDSLAAVELAKDLDVLVTYI